MQQLLDFPVNAKFSFQNFVVCEGNRAAFHFASRLASQDATENLLYIFGPSGSGKTHLLSALCAAVSADEKLSLPYLACRDIDEMYKGHFPAEEPSKLGEQFKDSPILLVDDIHLVPDNDNMRIEIWQLFNDFYNAGKKIAVTGLYPPKELPGLDGHLVSRLLWGLVAKVDVCDDDSRRMILKKLAKDRNIRVQDDVIEYFVTHAGRDIPALMDALESTRRIALATKRKISVKLAKEALGQD